MRELLECEIEVVAGGTDVGIPPNETYLPLSLSTPQSIVRYQPRGPSPAV